MAGNTTFNELLEASRAVDRASERYNKAWKKSSRLFRQYYAAQAKTDLACKTRDKAIIVHNRIVKSRSG